MGNPKYLTDVQQSDMTVWLIGICQRVSENNAHRFFGLALSDDQFEFHSLVQLVNRSIVWGDRMLVCSPCWTSVNVSSPQTPRRLNSARTASTHDGRMTASIFFIVEAAYLFGGLWLSAFCQLLIVCCSWDFQSMPERAIPTWRQDPETHLRLRATRNYG